MDIEPKYQAMTILPRHLEEGLLRLNIMQLCALVSEKKGNKWTGASDRYGPIVEISKRWTPEEIAKRLPEIPTEDVTTTYARIMAAHGGNPTKDLPPRQPRMDPSIKRTDTSRRTMIQPGDIVGPGLANCANVEDLKRVATEQGLTVNWEKVETLANFGLKRMYVGNNWRVKLRKEAT